MRILVLNGPNLNLLRQRDPEQYGKLSLSEIERLLIEEYPLHLFNFYQSNSEGELINQIQSSPGKFDGLIINPAGYSHTSVSIRDALELNPLPKVEVHLSHLGQREDFRNYLVTASACDGFICGFRDKSYLAAVYILEKIFSSK